MNKVKRIILASSLVMLASCATVTFADDNSDSSSECTTYLSWSDSSFLSNVSSNQSTAEDVATALTNCLHANDCTSISDSISDCDTLLGNRLYTASFYATKLTLEGNSGSSSSSQAVTPTTSSTSSDSAPSESSSTDSNNDNSSNSSSSDINW